MGRNKNVKYSQEGSSAVVQAGDETEQTRELETWREVRGTGRLCWGEGDKGVGTSAVSGWYS